MTTYHLESMRDERRYVTDTQMLDPIRFNSRLGAWLFKARHGKWHWNVVADAATKPTAEQPNEARRATAADQPAPPGTPPHDHIPEEFSELVRNVITVSIPIPDLHGADTPTSSGSR